MFGEHTEMQLLPYLKSHMMDEGTGVDATCVAYTETSLITQTRINRGGIASRRTRISDNVPIPKGVAVAAQRYSKQR